MRPELPNLEEMPRVGWSPGIYFLFRGEELIYIGSSVTPAGRVYNHSTYKGRFGCNEPKKFDRAFVFPVPEDLLKKAETAFIMALTPTEQGWCGGDGSVRKRTRLSTPIPVDNPKELLAYLGVKMDKVMSYLEWYGVNSASTIEALQKRWKKSQS